MAGNIPLRLKQVAEMSIGDDLRPVKWESYLSLVLKVG